MLVCFLGKIGYITGFQTSLKHLPRAPQKLEGIDHVKRLRYFSHRFPVKAVFMEVVVQPLPEISFDGRIFLKRISAKKKWKKTSYNKRFSYDDILNAEIMAKIGVWRDKLHYKILAFSVIAQ